MKELLPFIKLLRSHWDWAFLGIVVGIITLLASIGLLALSGWFLSGAAVAGLSIAGVQAFNLHTPSAGVRGFAFIRTLARYAERIISHETTLRLLTSLRVWFYQKIEPQAPASLHRYRSGDLLSRIVTDIDTLDSLFVRVLSPTIVALIVAAIVGSILWVLSPALTFVFFIFFLLAGVITPVIAGWAGRRLGAEAQKQQSELRSNLVEDLQGVADLSIYGARRRHIDQRLEESDHLYRLQEKMAFISGGSNALLNLLGGAAAVTALFVALPLAQSNYFPEPFLAFITFGMLAAFESIQPLPLAYQMLGTIQTAAKRLLEISEAPVTVTFPPDPAVCAEDLAITFDKVSFAYPDSGNRYAVRAVELLIPSQSTVALVGPSGSGKTTLAHLLTRFWDPEQGTIRLGDSDLRLFSEEQLRGMITMVSQKAHIFNATLRENLLIAHPDADDLQLRDVLEKAQLAEFVDSLPDGLDTWAGESGSLLSGGEGRRLVLARALLKNSPIWILDEPTEGLDNLNRRRFTETIFTNLERRSGLFITHTPEVLGRVAQVYFLEDGQVAACGKHSELLKDNPRYRHFIGNQAK